MRLRAAWSAALALLLAACATPAPPDALLSGLAVTRERIALAPDVVFHAALVAWKDDGSPPEVLARQRVDDAGSPPYALRLPYRQEWIHPGVRYQVQASVTFDDRLLLDLRQPVTVLLDPALRHVDVRLAPVPPLAATAQAGVPLAQTWWRLVEIVGDIQPLGPPAAQAQPAHLVLDAQDARIKGSGGCNRLAGRYEQRGASLRFESLTASLRLCLDGGLREPEFFDRLSQVASYWQQGRQLELRGPDGRPLLRFEALERGLPELAAPAARLSQ